MSITKGLSPIVYTPVTASGTSVQFTLNETGVKTFTLGFSGLSSSGTSAYIVRIGSSAGLVSTGYVSGGASFTGAPGVVLAASTTGFNILVGTLTAGPANYAGVLGASLVDATNNVWQFTSVVNRSDAAVQYTAAGFGTLPGQLDRVAITTAGGTDTFDAGTVYFTAG